MSSTTSEIRRFAQDDGKTPDLRDAARAPLAMRVPRRFLEEHVVVPVAESGDAVVVAAGGPLDPTVVDELARVFGRPVRLVDAPAAELQAALLAARHEEDAASPALADALPAADGEPGDDALDDLRALASQAPVVKLVNVLLLDALRLGASDVHLESAPDGLRVRYRLDGVLREVQRLAPALRAGAVSRVKILAGLDIAERRLPQDGRARVRVGDREIDLRVSTLPALHGESVVLRVLDHAGGRRDVAALGMDARTAERFARLLGRAGGIVLVTGPTGSGKTTTLYAALARVNEGGRKLVTVEDPVEYQLPGVVQIPVHPRAGLTFATALRSILRHDPDVIMVGETRDRETADVAIQAALTGHLVLTTLHTNDAPSAVTRLVDMGVEPFLVAATVQGVMAQRLVRVLCDACAEPHVPNASERAPFAELDRGESSPARWRRARGCERCAGTGYRGRTGLYELLVASEGFRELVVGRASLDALRARARADGMETLAADGWRRARAGVTTLDEVLRVVGEGAG